MNPYRNLPRHQFWSNAVTWAPPGGLDPVVEAPTILPGERVATMGSCFAQHLAKHISRIGLEYYVAENAPTGLPADEAREHNYGVFSARYGNIYTTRQALQLFRRAFHAFKPIDDVWEEKGGFVDAFRPRIQPKPFGRPDDVRDAAKEHLLKVRQVFQSADWLIFTLGLTETWQSRLDGAVYPLAPGVAGGAYDASKYEFINLSYDDVLKDMRELINGIVDVNPGCRIILTVSPVALAATYESRHVLVSTVASKAILRAVADTLERERKNRVLYFPSYEIITSAASEGRYYANDLREVNALGVSHVMRVFSKHFTPAVENVAPVLNEFPLNSQGISDIVCEEGLILQSLKAAGTMPGPDNSSRLDVAEEKTIRLVDCAETAA